MPAIGYSNIFETGTVTVDSEDATYPKENAYDWLPYPGDVWKPATSGTHYITVDAGAAVSADYFGVYSYDVDSIKLQYSNDNFSADINDIYIPLQNLLWHSEAFDSDVWSGSATVVANTDVAPDGFVSADTIIDSSASGYIDKTQNFAGFDVAKTYTFSVYIKKDSTPRATRFPLVRLLFSGSTVEIIDLTIDTSTGDSNFTSTGSGTGSGSVVDADDYWRVIVTGVSADAANTSVYAQIFPSVGASVFWFWSPIVTGSIIAWGAQLTESATVQTYIKTMGVSSAIYREFSTLSSRYWRFKVTKASAPSSLGILALGEKLTIPESVQVGFSPANLARTNKYLNSESDEGQFLGRRLIRNGSEMILSFDLLTPAFVRNSWDMFIQHAEVKPFFFAWDYANYPTEVAFCWTSGKIPKPVYNLPNFMRVALNVKANT